MGFKGIFKHKTCDLDIKIINIAAWKSRVNDANGTAYYVDRMTC